MLPNWEEKLLVGLFLNQLVLYVAKQGMGNGPVSTEVPELRDAKSEKW